MDDGVDIINIRLSSPPEVFSSYNASVHRRLTADVSNTLTCVIQPAGVPSQDVKLQTL